MKSNKNIHRLIKVLKKLNVDLEECNNEDIIEIALLRYIDNTVNRDLK